MKSSIVYAFFAIWAVALVLLIFLAAEKFCKLLGVIKAELPEEPNP